MDAMYECLAAISRCGGALQTMARVTFSILAAGALMVAQTVEAQDVTHLNLVITEGQTQCATVGQPFSNHFAVRLTDNLGIPFSGAMIGFANDGCYSYSAGTSTCPAPGHFESDVTGVLVPTDSSGVAVAPTYIAGTEPGAIAVYAYPPPQMPPYYFGYSQSLNHIVVFDLYQSSVAPPAPCDDVFTSGFD